jgi:hypothetical protein
MFIYICDKCGSRHMGPVDRPSPPVTGIAPRGSGRGGLCVEGEVLTTVLEPGTPGSPEESLATRLFIPRGWDVLESLSRSGPFALKT